MKMLADIIANVVILIIIPAIGLLAAFGDDRELIITGFAIFGIFILCMFVMVIM